MLLLSIGPLYAHARASFARHASSRDSREVIVRFRSNVPEHRRQSMSRAARISPRAQAASLRLAALPVPAGETTEAFTARLAREWAADIEFVEPNRLRYADATVNDPTQGYHLGRIGAPTAWDDAIGTGVTIAVADTGVVAAHPDLAANLLSGVNLSGVGTATDVTDHHGHGTAVAGTAAAVGNNGVGVVGVSYGSRILPIKITDDGTTDDFTIAQAIEYAADQGARVINISYSADVPAPAGCWTSTVITAAQYMRSKGGLVVVSAGNGGGDGIGDNKGCSNNPELIVVGATNSADTLASFSNFGAEVDVVAPGVLIPTTNCDGCTNGTVGVDYDEYSGTSFSAPITAATLALIFAVAPTLTADQAQQVLFDSASDLGASGYDTIFGWGRVNAASAMSLANGRAVFFQQQSLSNVNVYPNPWDIRKHTQRKVNFGGVPEGATVRIFTLSGYWVRTLTVPSGFDRAEWDLRNDAGDTVASGLYLYVVESLTGVKSKGRVAVIK